MGLNLVYCSIKAVFISTEDFDPILNSFRLTTSIANLQESFPGLKANLLFTTFDKKLSSPNTEKGSDNHQPQQLNHRLD